MINVLIRDIELRAGDWFLDSSNNVLRCEAPMKIASPDYAIISARPQKADGTFGDLIDVHFLPGGHFPLVASEQDVAPRVLQGLQNFTPEVRKVVYQYILKRACRVCFDLNCLEHPEDAQ